MGAAGSEHQRLVALLGRWKTEGWAREAPGVPTGRIDAVDVYEWLPGEVALLHRVDARVGDQGVEGAEIIGYDPERQIYLTQYFGSDGPTAYEATLNEEAGALVWRMRSEMTRFTGIFSDDGNTISGHWELLDDGSNWQPWMEITLTRQGS
ncbi:MAG: hypothetical protein V7607_6388 [Solirubrobacteraceae bacterium]